MTRDDQIIDLYKAGETLDAIGIKFDLSRERVGQIVRKSGFVLGKPEKTERIRAGIVAWHGRRKEEAVDK